jgi:prepilin-type N-terminal cleavage/methylation domain-containing protein
MAEVYKKLRSKTICEDYVMDRKQNAFTLIELLVVIAIIAMLLAILIPSLKIAKERAEEVVDEVNTKSCGQGVTMYCNNNKDRFPSPTDWIYLRFNRGVSPIRFPDDGGPLNYNCVWHNPDLDPDGVVAQYLDKKVLLCGTFKKIAPSRCLCTTSPTLVRHNGQPIEPQFNYSMNTFLGDINPWVLPNNLKKITLAKSPGTLLVFGEENPFSMPPGKRPTLPSGSQSSYNDCILYILEPSGAKAKIDAAGGRFAPIASFTLVDSLGTFHKAKDQEKYLGNTKAVFADGHTQTVTPEDSIKFTWPY